LAKKIDRTVVRNAAYKSSEFGLRERHNERKNESYHNGDIDISRADMNIHFHQNFTPAGEVETYEQTFNRLLDESKIVKRGLKPDAKVFDELIFDVNTAYFENKGEELGIGGYEYAKMFFEEAYRLAVKEIGGEFGEEYGEQLILSAVLHADERNRALSEDLGRDVYHYHLHVAYVPVVKKEILWSKRTKDKSLIGKVREIIPQISHSKKWPMRVPVERDGKTVILNSYSLLQDRFYEHMKAAGFEGFERGERGSTAEHLSDLDYKIQQDKKRLADKQAEVHEHEQALKQLNSQLTNKQNLIATKDKELESKDKKLESKDKELATKDKKIKRVKVDNADVSFIDTIGSKRDVFGRVTLTQEEAKTLQKLAQEGVSSRGEIHNLKFKLKRSNRDCDKAGRDSKAWEHRYDSLEKQYRHLQKRTKSFIMAADHAPKATAEMLTTILNSPSERPPKVQVQQTVQTQRPEPPRKKINRGMERY